MRLIIAGGRDYILTEEDFDDLDRINREFQTIEGTATFNRGISTVLSGCARGADTCGELWATHRGIPIERYPAQWKIHGKGAGYRRNEQMARNADALAFFPGGKGTRHMYNIARARGLTLYDVTKERRNAEIFNADNAK